MQKERWVVSAKRADFAAIGTKFGMDPVIARLIRNRDIVGEENIREYLYGDLSSLPDPFLLPDMERAVLLLAEKIREKKPIRILGDYDIDGVTSTYILQKGLQDLGAVVDHKIPDRVLDGYGLNEHLVQKASDDGIDTIVTCDNGIAASDQIALARKLGMTVIVTDHHEVPYEETEDGRRRYLLPPADAVVNPKREDSRYPSGNLCGAAVAWKLISALEARFGRKPEESSRFLEFVAIATVGDVMELKGENRILVREGLKSLHQTKHPGLLALIHAQGLEPENITPYHIGFVLGPCINASGRLDTAERSLALLTAKTEEEAAKLAGDLKNLNDSRKELTRKWEQEAIRLVEETSLKDDKVLVVYLPECQESLAGLVAGRLKERFHKPSIAITKSEYGVKGSGRSIEAYSMYDELCKCRELFTNFGGHPMAAGLSMDKEEKVELLRETLNRNAELTDDDFVEKITIDIAMPVSYLSRNLIRQMKVLEPFGQGNQRPLFAEKGLSVLSLRVFGKNRNVVKLQLEETGGTRMDGVYFGDGDAFSAYVSEHPSLSITYYPEIDTWHGREKLQVVIQNYF